MRYLSLIALSVVLVLFGVAGVDAGEPKSKAKAPFEAKGVLYKGYASIPWYGAYSPDGRFIAVVEGHMKDFVRILDAKTHKVIADLKPEGQPASHQPVFTSDGERLILIEKDALVVRGRAQGWKATERIPLGFQPGINRRLRALRISPNDRRVAFVNDGKAYVVNLVIKRSRRVKVDAPADVHFVGDLLAVTRWSDQRKQTDFLDITDRPMEGINHATLAFSPDGVQRLVANEVRKDGARELAVVWGENLMTRFEISLPYGDLTAAMFSPKGKYLLIIEDGKRATIWDAMTGAVLQRITDYETDRMISAVFSPDGKTLITSGRRTKKHFEEAVMVWRLATAAKGKGAAK